MRIDATRWGKLKDIAIKQLQKLVHRDQSNWPMNSGQCRENTGNNQVKPDDNFETRHDDICSSTIIFCLFGVSPQNHCKHQNKDSNNHQWWNYGNQESRTFQTEIKS